MGSHERIGVFRIFGRDAGFTALYSAYVTSIRCGIPEAPFDLEKMVHLLVTDKKNNPSRYALVVLSEGATWAGREVEEYGPPDAYGHRKKVNIAEAFSDQLRGMAGEETVVYDLTYQLRSGDPDFLDKMVATTFATMALECHPRRRPRPHDGRSQRLLHRTRRSPIPASAREESTWPPCITATATALTTLLRPTFRCS